MQPETQECGAVGVAMDDGRVGERQVTPSKLFILEAFTPLYHISEYGSLPDSVRLRYNQLHALYFNEQVAFFEQEMLSPALLALLQSSLPPRLSNGLRVFFDEEQRHTATFRALNHRCAPEFYTTSPYYFVRVARRMRAPLNVLAAQPRLFPLLVWLALLQEERSLYYSKACVAKASDLDHRFVALHRAHLADEVGHVAWDEELLDWLWPQVGRLLRFVNIRLLDWLIGEFFLLPKRSGLRVVRQLVNEHPNLDAGELERGMRQLGRNSAYLETLYSRAITPRSFARFDRDPGFALLARTLPGYRPTRSAW